MDEITKDKLEDIKDKKSAILVDIQEIKTWITYLENDLEELRVMESDL